MSKAGRSLFVFGLYTVANGLGLLLVPDLFLGLFGLPPAADVWVRVAGMLIALLGYYYAAAGMQDSLAFIRLTVPGRGAIFLFYVVMVTIGSLQPITLVVGAIDLLGAAWTAWALRSP